MIVKAAVRVKNRIFRGVCHKFIIAAIPRGFEKGRKEGFVTDTGEFLDRKTAYQHALAAGQIEPLTRNYLKSEDIEGLGEKTWNERQS